MDGEQVTIAFRAQDSGEKGVFIVRRVGGCVGICISLESNGDVEAFVDHETLRKLIAALGKDLA